MLFIDLSNIMSEIKRICLIGSGNVATHLGQAFFRNDIRIDCVYSRTLENARQLSTKLDAYPTDNPDLLGKHSDLYLICVSDQAIPTIYERIVNKIPASAIIAHTSGAVPSLPIVEKAGSTGVFYPLQSFNKERELNLETVPFLITAQKKETADKLMVLAKKLSAKTVLISDQERLTLHLAAVFANNFTNHLLNIAEQIAENNELDFDLLLPLIEETLTRIRHTKPSLVQTGPASRNDLVIIQKHLEILKNNPTWSAVYSLLSQSIMGQYFGRESE